MLNSWIIFVILYLIIATIFDQTYKVATKNMIKPGALTVLLEFLASILVLVLVPFFEIKFPTDIKVYLFLGLSIIFYAISDRLNTNVRKGVEASTFSIMKQLSTVFMTFSGFLFFKEPFVITKFIGAILIIFSNIIIFYKKGEGKFNKYVGLGIISNICYTIALFLDVNYSECFNLPFYVMLTLGVPAILIIILERIKLSDLKNEFTKENRLPILITSVSWSFCIVAQLRAYQLGSVSVVAPLCSLLVIINVIVGYIALKEKDNLIKKIIAALLIILGIILIKI
jgi:drug/metabolite transporter (DMT)-like permease